MSGNDAVGNFLGQFGKWQFRSILLIYLVKIPCAWFMACIIFTAKSPTNGEIFCKPSFTVSIENTSSWIASVHKKTFNRVENEESYNFCLARQNVTESFDSDDVNSTFVECTAFDHRPTFYSLIHQYKLFCSREALVALSQSFHLFGVLLGGLIAFYLLKTDSPRRIMLYGMIAQIFIGLMVGYAPNYELHLFFRCSAAATCGMMSSGIMIVSDITSGKYRVGAICLFEQFWSIGMILLPGVASWWSSWGTIYVAITLPTLSLIILCYWIPDSPRWLLKHGKVYEAEQLLIEAAQFNNKNYFVEDDLHKQLIELADTMRYSPPEPTLLSIWDVPFVIKLRLLVGHVGWSVYLMLYYASLLNVRAMGRNYLEVNTAIAGIAEIIGTFIAMYLIFSTSKKWLYMSLFNIVASLITYSANFVPHTFPPFERMVIYMGTAMLSKISISTGVACFVTSMAEIVPEDKRKMCNFSGVTCSRSLVVIAPFIGYFVIYGQLVPLTIMAVMNVCVSVLIAIFIKTPRTIPVKPIPLPNEKEIVQSFIKM